MSTGSLYSRIRRGGDDDKNTGYARNRSDAPLGSDTSSDQLVASALVGADEMISTNLAAGTERSRRWRLLSGTPSRRQNSRDPRPLASNCRRISVHCSSLRRTPLLRILGITSSSPSASQCGEIRRTAIRSRRKGRREERRCLTAYVVVVRAPL